MRLSRSLSVQITTGHPSSETKDDRLSLYKWWPGGRSTFNINSRSQWEAIKEIVDPAGALPGLADQEGDRRQAEGGKGRGESRDHGSHRAHQLRSHPRGQQAVA